MPVASNDNRGAQVTTLGSFLGYQRAYDVSLMATGGAGTAASPWTGWETSLNLVAQDSRVWFPAGEYTQASIITMKKGWVVEGDGKEASTINSSIAGTAFRTAFTANSSNVANLTVRNLRLINSNASNIGSGILECAGSYIHFSDLSIHGFKFGITLNQSVHVEIHSCTIAAQQGVGIWLVNGPDYITTGSRADLDLSSYSDTYRTNRIHIHDCQNSQGGTVIGIVDDGGAEHVFDNNNYDSGATNIRIYGVISGRISDSMMESSSAASIITAATLWNGGGTADNQELLIQNCRIIPDAGQNCISVADTPTLTLINNTYQSTVVAVTGLNNCTSFVAFHDAQDGAGALYDNRAKALIDSSVAQRHAKAYATGDQTITTATLTPVNLDAEAYDIGGFHDTVTNNTRMTIPADGATAGTAAGLYRISGQIQWAASATNARMAAIRKNGSTYLGYQRILAASASVSTVVAVTVDDVAVAGDYYELIAWQNSGGDLATDGLTADLVWLSAVRIH